MRIVILTTYTYPEFSGSGRNAFNFARHLVMRGQEVTLLTFNPNLRFRASEIHKNVSIKRIPYFPGHVLLKLLSLFSIIPSYFFFLLRNDGVIIYGSRIIGYELMILMGNWLRKKVIFRPLMLGVDDLESVLKSKSIYSRWFYKRLMNRQDMYYSINPEFSRQYLSYGNRPGTLFESPQGVDISVFHPVDLQVKMKIRQELSLDEKAFVIVSIGFVVPRKGYLEIIESLRDLPVPFIYIVVGEYEYSKQHFLYKDAGYAKQVVESGKNLLGSKLRFMGSREDVVKWLAAADVFLHNSFQEGFPNALLEAMASGICPLVRSLPGLRNSFLKDGENCILFDNMIQMTEQLLRLYHQPDVQAGISRNAVRDSSLYASFDKVAETFLSRIGA